MSERSVELPPNYHIATQEEMDELHATYAAYIWRYTCLNTLKPHNNPPKRKKRRNRRKP